MRFDFEVSCYTGDYIVTDLDKAKENWRDIWLILYCDDDGKPLEIQVVDRDHDGYHGFIIYATTDLNGTDLIEQCKALGIRICAKKSISLCVDGFPTPENMDILYKFWSNNKEAFQMQ